MHGYDISWAAFNIIEVMSSTKLTHKVLIYITISHFMMKMCLQEKNIVFKMFTKHVTKYNIDHGNYPIKCSVTSTT